MRWLDYVHLGIGAVAILDDVFLDCRRGRLGVLVKKIAKIGLSILIQNRICIYLKKKYTTKERPFKFPSGGVMFSVQCGVRSYLKHGGGDEVLSSAALYYIFARYFWSDVDEKDILGGVALGAPLGLLWHKII